MVGALPAVRSINGVEPGSNLPQLVRVGVTVNDHFNTGPLVGWTPIAGNGIKGSVWNLHDFGPHRRLPDRFILPDGAFTTFRAIDKTPGSPLHGLIVKAARDAKSIRGLSGACAYLSSRSSRYSMKFARNPLFLPKLPQEQLNFLGKLPLNPALGNIYETNFTLPTRDFYKIAETYQGVCIDQAIWNVLVLQEMGYKVGLQCGRMVASINCGHTWGRFDDGRVHDGEVGLYRPAVDLRAKTITQPSSGLSYMIHPSWGFFVLE
jgi:hypothetical protein